MNVVEYPDFLHKSECDYIIDRYGKNLVNAGVYGDSEDSKYRVAESTTIQTFSDMFVYNMCMQISELIKVPLENHQYPDLVKYNVGGKYDYHYDFFHPDSNNYEEAVVFSSFGQRTHTCLIYLNDDFTGGYTHFKNIDKTIKPKTGKMVVWTNVDSSGEPDYDTLHAGLPLVSGVKWIITIFINQFSRAKVS